MMPRWILWTPLVLAIALPLTCVAFAIYIDWTRTLPNGYRLIYTRNGPDVNPIIGRPNSNEVVLGGEIPAWRVFDEYVVGRTEEDLFFIIDTRARVERLFVERAKFLRQLDTLGITLDETALQDITGR